MKLANNKVGSIAISTVDFNNWTLEASAEKNVPKTRKIRGAKEVLPSNKIFAECAKVITDPFWIEKFNNASYGKMPPKCYYNDGNLSYRKGAKNIILQVPINPHEAAPKCIEFFRVNLCIFSPLDQQNALDLQQERAYHQSMMIPEELKWENTNKKVQESLISYYVNDIKVIMILNDDQVEQLRQTIKSGIAAKIFGKTSIELSNNRIKSIDGLLWNDQDKIFYINPELKPKITRTYGKKKEQSEIIHKDSVPQFGLKWNKYVDSLDKKLISNIQRQHRLESMSSYNAHSASLTSPGVTTDVEDDSDE